MVEEIDSIARPIEIPAKHFGITLRQFTINDACRIFNLINRNRDHLSQFGDETSVKYPTLKSVEDSIINPKNKDRMRFGIWNTCGDFVGSINLTPDENNPRKGEIGYYLGSEFTGSGYMLKSLLTLSGYAFYVKNYEEVYAKIHRNNLSSQKVVIKAGFIENGIEKEDKIFLLRKP